MVVLGGGGCFEEFEAIFERLPVESQGELGVGQDGFSCEVHTIGWSSIRELEDDFMASIRRGDDVFNCGRGDRYD